MPLEVEKAQEWVPVKDSGTESEAPDGSHKTKILMGQVSMLSARHPQDFVSHPHLRTLHLHLISLWKRRSLLEILLNMCLPDLGDGISGLKQIAPCRMRI